MDGSWQAAARARDESEITPIDLRSFRKEGIMGARKIMPRHAMGLGTNACTPVVEIVYRAQGYPWVKSWGNARIKTSASASLALSTQYCLDGEWQNGKFHKHVVHGTFDPRISFCPVASSKSHTFLSDPWAVLNPSDPRRCDQHLKVPGSTNFTADEYLSLDLSFSSSDSDSRHEGTACWIGEFHQIK